VFTLLELTPTVIGTMTKPRPFHRLFGLAWMDFLEDTPARVEAEVDIATQQMLLDVAIAVDNSDGLPRSWPDGCEEMGKHNAITFKSYREPLDYWALWELAHHYVGLRYRVSPREKLLPESDFRLFAIAVRRPQILDGFSGLTQLKPLKPGVYGLTVLDRTVRLIVIHELPLTPNNAMLHLFSAREDAIRFGMSHYRERTTTTSALICELFQEYLEDPNMSDLLKEFAQQTIKRLLESLPPEERLKGVPAEERLKGVPAEERLKGVPTEERLKGVPAEERLKGVPAEERLKGVPIEERLKGLSPSERLAGLSAGEVLQGLSPEAIEALLRKLKGNGTAHEPK
jgi:hypothetical protein